ncbi:hypothetical protein G6R29_01790 [Fructobacillus sp. M2-14]|uniref:Uncharacterized protein n=1 Tax=Fructobacillus broussonetiae TaxID=2713173 RepID=A0ABS5R2I6_9LACO|nr:hypothetical protein [Fructobacillus broussonetiae]MBS9338367.1 hypothetical protein [Fructobacillus broussonetiae]
MTKISKYKKQKYTILSNQVLHDDRLSWKARGIFGYLYAQHNDWDFYEIEVMKHATDGRASLRSGLKELEEHGYLKRKRVKDDKGHWGVSEWIINDEPMFDFRTYGNRTCENQTLTNTNLTNTNNNKGGETESVYTTEQFCDFFQEKIGLIPDQFLFKELIDNGYSINNLKDVVNMAKSWTNPKNLTPSRLYARIDQYLTQAHEMGYFGGITPEERSSMEANEKAKRLGIDFNFPKMEGF